MSIVLKFKRPNKTFRIVDSVTGLPVRSAVRSRIKALALADELDGTDPRNWGRHTIRAA